MDTDLNTQRESAAEEMRRVYTETVVDHVLNPRNTGAIANADGLARLATAGGDDIRVWLRVKDGRISEATFWTDGCAATIASLSMVTELARGSSVAGALGIGPQDIVDALGGLPDGNLHCAEQAADVLKQAVRDYLAVKREPWKRAYRRH